MWQDCRWADDYYIYLETLYQENVRGHPARCAWEWRSSLSKADYFVPRFLCSRSGYVSGLICHGGKEATKANRFHLWILSETFVSMALCHMDDLTHQSFRVPVKTRKKKVEMMCLSKFLFKFDNISSQLRQFLSLFIDYEFIKEIHFKYK